jgi:hypothetical protein
MLILLDKNGDTTVVNLTFDKTIQLYATVKVTLCCYKFAPLQIFYYNKI